MSKNLTFLLSLFLGFLNLSVFGQLSGTITTDRPGQALNPNTIGKQIFQIQSGIELSSYENTSYLSQLSNTTKWDNVLRYGFSNRLDLGLGFVLQNDEIKQKDSVFYQRGISGLSLKMRHELFRGSEWLNILSYQIEFGIPVVSDDYSPSYIAPSFTLISNHSLTDKLGFTTNWAFVWNGENSEPSTNFVLNIDYTLHSKFGVFIEYYAFRKTSNYDGNWDFGLSYLAKNHLQFDISAGLDQQSSNENEWFLSTGISWRWPK